jgi:hypothetical protein
MKRFRVGAVATAPVVAALIGIAVSTSAGPTTNTASTSVYASPTASQMVAGPVDGGLLPQGNGGHVACPNHQPCGEVGPAAP